MYLCALFRVKGIPLNYLLTRTCNSCSCSPQITTNKWQQKFVCFEHTVYINFENNQLLAHLFEKDFDIDRILLELQIATRETITPNTLLLFDEIQEVKRGVTALKYFYELRPEQPIIAAGSLLGIAMHRDDSFPVGKVDFMTLYPLSFCEFAEAMGEELLIKQTKQQNWDLITSHASRLEDLLRKYYYIGGMPEVVNAFIQNTDFVQVRTIQQAIYQGLTPY